MKKLLILIILVLPFIIINCKDKPKPEFFIDQETKDYTVFKEGTYWVYENQLNEIDSQYVKLYSRDYGDANLSYTPEAFQLNINSTFYNDEIVYQTNIERDKTTFTVNQLWTKSFSNFFYTYTSSDSIIAGGVNLINIEDTSFIYNNGFSDFKEVKKFIANSNIKNSYTEVYWAKHIGRIEYLDTEGNRWRLKRFKIIQ